MVWRWFCVLYIVFILFLFGLFYIYILWILWIIVTCSAILPVDAIDQGFRQEVIAEGASYEHFNKFNKCMHVIIIIGNFFDILNSWISSFNINGGLYLHLHIRSFFFFDLIIESKSNLEGFYYAIMIIFKKLWILYIHIFSKKFVIFICFLITNQCFLLVNYILIIIIIFPLIENSMTNFMYKVFYGF